jgi:hypothetical protein
VAAAQKPLTLRMGALAVAAPFRGRQLVYRYDDLKYEADFYSEFFVAPASMLSEATARALVSSNTFKRVIPPGAAPDDGDYQLDGFVTSCMAMRASRQSPRPCCRSRFICRR